MLDQHTINLLERLVMIEEEKNELLKKQNEILEKKLDYLNRWYRGLQWSKKSKHYNAYETL